MSGPIETHEPISMIPAPGWRAVYLDADGDGPGWHASQLACWAVCQVMRHHRPGPGLEEAQHIENQVNGMVLAGGGEIDRADNVGNFWKYLEPGEPDPTPQEVAGPMEHYRRERARRLGGAA